MAKFLLAVWSFDTHLDSFLSVGSALREHGHEVAFYAGPHAAAEVTSLGFRVFPFENVDESLAERSVAGILADRARPPRLRQHWHDFLIAQLPGQFEDFKRLTAKWRPDVIVCDMVMLAPFVSLQDLGFAPTAVLSHVGYCMSPGPRGPVSGGAFPPERKGIQRLRAAVTRSIANLVTSNIPSGIDSFRKSLGLPAQELRVVEWYARAALYLIPSARELDFDRRDVPPNVRYVGPCLWPPLQGRDVSLQGSRIVVDEGSFHTAEPVLLQAAVQAFRESDREFVIIAGKRRSGAMNIGDPGPKGRIVSWRPVDDELDGAALLVTNGNTESVLTGLARGIPVLAVPSILDQAELALRAKRSGAGEVIEQRVLSARSLRDCAIGMLTDPAYRQNAQRACSQIASYRGTAEAVSHLVQVSQARALQCA